MSEGLQIGLAVVGGVLLVHVLAPTRMRQLWQSLFSVFVLPTREVATVTTGYLQGHQPRLESVLNGAGMQQHRLQKVAGTVLTIAVGVVAAMAELELLILTVSGMGMGDKKPSIVQHFPLNAADATALALFGGMFVAGVCLLDATNFTHWLPLPLDDRRRRIALGVVAGLLLAGGVATLYEFSDFRAVAISMSTVVAAEEENGAEEDAPAEVPTLSIAAFKGIYFYLAVLLLATGIVSFAIFPAMAGVIVALVLLFGVVAAKLVGFGCTLWEGLVTAVCNVVLMGIEVVTGIFSSIGAGLRKLIGADDSPVKDELSPAPAVAAGATTAGNPEVAAPLEPAGKTVPASHDHVPAVAAASAAVPDTVGFDMSGAARGQGAVPPADPVSDSAAPTPPAAADPEQDSRWDPLG